MKRKISFQSFIFIAATLFLACKQPIDFLTPATQTGQNTLSFLIDGRPYIPQGASQLLSHENAVRGGLYGRSYQSGLYLNFSTYGSTDNNGSITVHLDDYKLGMNPVNNGDLTKGNLIGRKYFAYYSRGNGFFTPPPRTKAGLI